MGYLGQTSAIALTEKLRSLGIGEATQRGEWPPKRLPYFLDNGAYADHGSGRAFNAAQYAADVEAIRENGPTPDFIVAPDRVASPASLEMSLSWLPRLQGVAPLALVVQDGMTDDEVLRVLKHFAVLFVGGSLPWKLKTIPRWIAVAREAGVRCHIGRMGTGPRVRYARLCGADSVDSCTPLWKTADLRIFLRALRGPLQEPIGPPHPPPPRSRVWTKAKDRRAARALVAPVESRNLDIIWRKT